MLLEARERHDRVVAGHALHRRHQRQQAVLGDRRRDLGGEARGARRFGHDDAAARARDRREDRVEVVRLERRDVDHFGGIALLGERIGRRERLVHHRAPGDQRDVGAFAQREAGVERQRLAVVLDLLLEEAIEPRRLEEDHRIGIAYRGEQQPVGAPRRGGIDDADARDVREHRLGAFRVMLRARGCRRRRACAAPSGR